MIKQSIIIPNATAKQVYKILLDSKLHSKITGDKATIDPTEGGLFSTFSGYADGKTTKLITDKLIEQTWRASDWDDDFYSNIVFELKDIKDGVEILFTQNNMPKGSEEEFIAGWQDNYWQPLKEYFK